MRKHLGLSKIVSIACFFVLAFIAAPVFAAGVP
jgi:hypothetical protein